MFATNGNVCTVEDIEFTLNTMRDEMPMEFDFAFSGGTNPDEKPDVVYVGVTKPNSNTNIFKMFIIEDLCTSVDDSDGEFSMYRAFADAVEECHKIMLAL